jgi:hypothetical protein
MPVVAPGCKGGLSQTPFPLTKRRVGRLFRHRLWDNGFRTLAFCRRIQDLRPILTVRTAWSAWYTAIILTPVHFLESIPGQPKET